jgi:hypothetical protein
MTTGQGVLVLLEVDEGDLWPGQSPSYSAAWYARGSSLTTNDSMLRHWRFKQVPNSRRQAPQQASRLSGLLSLVERPFDRKKPGRFGSSHQLRMGGILAAGLKPDIIP